MDSIIILKSVYRRLMEGVGREPPETGAIIGVRSDSKNVIVVTWIDTIAGNGKISYRPSCEAIDEVVSEWKCQGIEFGGVFHSHRAEYSKLSPADLASANLIMKNNYQTKMILGLFYGSSLDVYYAFQTSEKCASICKANLIIR